MHVGQPGEDIFTGRKFCPAIAGLSPVYWSLSWYVLFLITCSICFCRGRVIRTDRFCNSSDAEKKLSRYLLDCARAGYTDAHLTAWFVVMTFAFLHSICARIVATPEGDNIHNACLRYGDWRGHQDYCQPGGLLEPSWTVTLLGTYMCFSAALMDQGTISWDLEASGTGDGEGEDQNSRRGWCWVVLWPCHQALRWLTVQERPKTNISEEEEERRKDQGCSSNFDLSSQRQFVEHDS